MYFGVSKRIGKGLRIGTANDQSAWWFSPVAPCLFFWIFDGSRSHHRKQLMMAAVVDGAAVRRINDVK